MLISTKKHAAMTNTRRATKNSSFRTYTQLHGHHGMFIRKIIPVMILIIGGTLPRIFAGREGEACLHQQ
jgi:hypothetical protein